MKGAKPKEIAEKINAKYGSNFSPVQIRDKIRYYPEYNLARAQQVKERPPVAAPEPADLLKVLYRNTKPLDELTRGLGISERVLRAQIEDMVDVGYLIEEVNGVLRLCTTVIPADNTHIDVWRGERIIRFGAIGDTHLGNKWQQMTALIRMYEIFEEEGIEVVYHAGDMVDGFYKSRPGHIYELFKIGADEQANYVIENYPRRPGIKTRFITGNHDNTHVMNGGTNIGIRIGQGRDDMEFLGMDNAKVKITPHCTLEVNHPGDGSQYALSYSLQKLIDSMTGGEKPNILLNGHHHKAMYLPIYRNIHSLEVGTFEAQTPFMKSRKLAAHVGGWICTAHVGEEGTVTRFSSEFFPFYKPLKNDY